MRLFQLSAVALYLLAVVAANLAVTLFGKWALPFTALALIPLDLFTRDVLHSRWAEDGRRALAVKMFCLIAAGGALSIALNFSAVRIATASCLAFVVSSTIDFFIFTWIKGSFGRRSFLSNIASAISDSFIFPLVAFSTLVPSLFAAQSGLKIVGGAAWLLIYLSIQKRFK